MPIPAPKVFITGASSGIGMALARQYAKRGAILGLVARRGETLSAFACEFPWLTVLVYPADVRDAAALQAAADHFLDQVGTPDVVISNAGISVGSMSGQGDLEAFRAVMDTNYFGMVATFEPFVGAMTLAGRGALVGIASVAGMRGLPGAAAYSASKAAVLRYLESLRVELRAANVGVVTVAPGYIRTPMTHRNPYRMPFLMDVDAFAAKTVRAIDRRVRFAVFPWPMRIVGILMSILPRALYDALAANAPHKPRAGQE